MKKTFLTGVTRKNERSPAEGFGGPGRVIFNTVLIFLASQLVAAFIAELGLNLIHPNTRQSLDNSIGAQFVFVLIAEGLAAGFVLRIIKRRHLGLAAIGLGRRPIKSDLWKAGLGFLAFYTLLIGAGVLVNIFAPSINNGKQDVGFNNIHSGLDSVLAIIALVILPPLGEETLVRGYLYSGLRKAWKFWPAMLVTSLVFGTAHLAGADSGVLWSAGIDTFLLSIILVFLREKTGALYAGMLVHLVNNLIAYSVHIK